MKKLLLLLITTLMTLPLVTAGLSDVELTWNDAPNDQVQAGVAKPTNIQFTFQPENDLESRQATLNATGITDQSITKHDSLTVLLGNDDYCDYDGDKYTCTITHQYVDTNGGELEIVQSQNTEIPISLTVETENGPVTYEAGTSVTIDDDPPVPTYLGPPRCQDQDTCYVNDEPTNISASFEAETGPLHQQNVVAIVEGTETDPIRFVGEGACDDTTCNTTATIDCSNGDELTLTHNTPATATFSNKPPTKDDAWHMVEDNIEAGVTCDTEPPSINSVSVSGPTQGVPTVESGATITVDITENTPKPPRIRASLDETTSSQCTPTEQDNEYTCTIEPPATDEAGTQEIDLAVTDAAGNTAQRALTVNYLSTVEEQSDIWRSPDTTFLSSPVNKDILQAEPKVYSKATFDATDSEASLHDVSLQGCSASDSALKSVEVDHVASSDNKAYFTYTLRQPGEYNKTVDTNRLTTNCTLQVTGRTDEFIYTQGESENMTLTVPLQSGTRLSQKLKDEISDTREDIEDYKGAWTKIGKGIEISQKVCRTGSILEGLFSKYSVSGLSLSQSQVGRPAAEAMKPPQDIAREKASGEWRKRLGKFCDFMTCQTDRQQNNVDLLNQQNEKILDSADWIDAQGGNWEGKLQGYSGQRFKQTYNPYNSFAAAAVGMCPPAIRKHTRSYMQTECNYLSCLAQSQERTGFSVERCRAQRDRAQCTFIGDQIMSSTPGLNMISQQLGSINKLLSDPVAAGATLVSRFVCPVAQDSFLYFMCETGSTYNKYLEYYQDFNQLRQVAEYTKVFKEGPSDVCEEAMSATSDDSIYWERQNEPDVLTARQAAEQAGLSDVETLGGTDETSSGEGTPEEEAEDPFTPRQNCLGLSPSSGVSSDCPTSDSVTIQPDETTGTADTGTDASPGGSGEDTAVIEWGDDTIRWPEDGEGGEGGVSPGDDSEIGDGLGTDAPETIGKWNLEYTAGASAVLTNPKTEEKIRLNADGEFTAPSDLIDNPEEVPDEFMKNGRAQIPREKIPDSLGGVNVTGLASQIEDANDRKFKNRLNRRAGPPVDLEEAREIRDELSTASPAALQRTNALRDVSEEMAYGSSLGEQNVKIPVKGGGEKTAEEYLVENTDLDEGEIKDLTKDEIRREVEEQLNASTGDITAARYNATPGQMSAWNAGETGRMILQLRSAGWSGWNSYDGTWFSWMEDVTNTVDDFANPQRAMCGQNDIQTVYGEASVDTAITTINGTPDIGALVGGSKAEFTTPTGTTNTSYVIGYKAITAEEGLTFNIILQGDQGTKDVTEQLAGSSPITVPKQDDDHYKVATRGDFTLAKSYDEVCMRFNQNPSQYFLRTTFNGNKLCQGLRQ